MVLALRPRCAHIYRSVNALGSHSMTTTTEHAEIDETVRVLPAVLARLREAVPA